MIKRIAHNWSIKLICLAVAGSLWIYVSASQSTLGKLPGSLKIKAINVPSGLVATYDSKTVDIKVMAEPAVWRKLSPDSFSAYVDLSGTSVGTVDLTVNVVSSVPGVQIVERDPDDILVSLESIITKEVGITSKVEGNAAEGLTSGEIKLTPDKVTVKGAKSIVDSISEAFITLNLNGESASFKRSVGLKAYDDKGEEIKSVEFSPTEVSADVDIVKAANNKTVGVKVVTQGMPKSGYYVSDISVNPNVVDVIGPRTILSEVNFVETNAIDLSDQSTSFERDVGLSLSNGLVLQSGTATKVHVKITLAINVLSREMPATISPVNIDSNYKLSLVNPDQLKVVVSGPGDIVNSLKASDIFFSPDMSGKGVGVYNLNISSADFKLPDSLVVSSVLPSAVSISIDRK